MELLDGLPADSPAARTSRRDLRRIHRWMRTRSILLQAWQAFAPGGRGAIRVLELGAGDGTLLLGVARALSRGPATERRPAELTLLDRQDLVARDTVDAYARAGWTARPRTVDVLDWIAAGEVGASAGETAHWNLIVANLFLHHFDDAALARLLRAVASRTDSFLACEPRRGGFALAASHLVGFLGANAVTRTDSVLSVRAGFRGEELSALWPDDGAGWRVREFAAAPFSHCFQACRSAPP